MCAMEAMALGTPVVSTPSDGMKDLITDGVSGFLAEEDAVLAQDLLRLVTDGELRSSIARNAAEKFARINDAEGYRRIMERCYRQGGTL